jgi:predicted nucleotidyltransferase
MPKSVTRPSMEHIRAVVNQIVERFHPRKIVLFGSYAYGRPTLDSDVDLLVVLHSDSSTPQDAAVISQAIDHPFPLDIVVQGASDWEEYLQEGAIFARQVSEKGLVLYEASDARVG